VIAPTAETSTALDSPSGSLLGRFTWHCRNNPKRELWFAWWATVVFYNFFTVSFFILSHTQPPANPGLDAHGATQWFHHNHYGILVGFGIVFAVTGLTTPQNALIAYSMRRMSVSPAYGYSYLVLYSLSAVPGMLLLCITMTVGAMRPDRDPELQQWLFDLAFLSYVGTMGVFLIGSLVWMLAILIDKNRVFPKWFGYLNLCNALTEVVVSPAWIFHHGVFAWNGVIAWWIDMVVFGIYTGVFITLLRQLILREDFGTGLLPEPAPKQKLDASDLARTAS
jgi:hypothetical protein